jgi:hypothetical protein
MQARGEILGLRLLIDFSMARREPSQTAQMREKLGRGNIRVAATHSKFALFQNADWKVCLRTSMNLNTNPRNEDFLVGHDPELTAFLNGILDEVWAKQGTAVADLPPGQIIQHWQSDL